MGATAALQHAHFGARVLSFAPRVDLELSHGKFIPAAARAASVEAIASGLAAGGERSVAVHVGTGNHEKPSS